MNNTNIPTTKNTKLNLRLRERGMSLRLLSRVSGVAYATVYNLFTGKKSICDASAGTVRKLSTALDMSMDNLYDEMQNQAGNSGGGVDPAPIRDFTLMWRNEIIADLMISDGKVLIERYSTSPAKQIFQNFLRLRSANAQLWLVQNDPQQKLDALTVFPETRRKEIIIHEPELRNSL